MKHIHSPRGGQELTRAAIALKWCAAQDLLAELHAMLGAAHDGGALGDLEHLTAATAVDAALMELSSDNRPRLGL